MSWIYLAFTVLIFLFLLLRKRLFLYRLLNNSSIVYMDDGNSKTVVDGEYMVSSKPDRVVNFRGKKILIEYKSRKKGVYDRDVVQALSSALAVWDRFDRIDAVVVYNGGYDYKKITLHSKKQLFKKINKYVVTARKVKVAGSYSGRANHRNCPTCPYKVNCKWAS